MHIPCIYNKYMFIHKLCAPFNVRNQKQPNPTHAGFIIQVELAPDQPTNSNFTDDGFLNSHVGFFL